MRLIDADTLEPDAEYDDGEFWAYSITQIENAPTIEPERKRGRWLKAGTYHGVQIFECSECNADAEVPTIMGDPLWRYCPHCGVQMEEGEQE